MDLSAIFSILHNTGELEDTLSRLRNLVESDPILVEDLEGYLRQPIGSSAERRRQERSIAADQRHQARDTGKAKASWIAFARRLKADPFSIADRSLRAKWPGPADLWELTRWLEWRVDKQAIQEPVTQWRLLEEGFGATVAQAYRDGMKSLWRVILPERPERSTNGGITRKKTTELAFKALILEASEDPIWHQKLSTEEVRRAARHACWSEVSIPHYFDALVQARPGECLSVIQEALALEWTNDRSHGANFFHHYAYGQSRLTNEVITLIIDAIEAELPRNIQLCETALRCLQRVPLSNAWTTRLCPVANAWLKNVQNELKESLLPAAIGLLFLCDAEHVIAVLEQRLSALKSAGRNEDIVSLIGTLFDDRHNGPYISKATMHALRVPSLEAPVRLAYQYVDPRNDIRHEGSYTPRARSRSERSQRYTISSFGAAWPRSFFHDETAHHR